MRTKEETSTCQKNWRLNHKKEIAASSKNWRRNNKEKIVALHQSPKQRFGQYQRDAKKRGITFSLTLKDHFSPRVPNTYWQKPCTYCSDKIETVGLDRIDNAKGYTVDNVVPCCSDCNWTRNNIWTYEEMKTIIGPALAKAKKLREINSSSELGSSEL